MKETLKETNRLKSKCSAKSSIYALLMVPYLLLLLAIAMWPLAMAIQPLYRIHISKQYRNELCEYAICEITNPQSYYSDQYFVAIFELYKLYIMYKEVAVTYLAYFITIGRPNSNPKGIFKPIAIALKRLLNPIRRSYSDKTRLQ